jgi:hypothetical protein
MNKAQTLAASLCLAFAAMPAAAAGRPIVVELFTSEGCSSCPPADALLAELVKRPDVLALSFHVDYWDRLGWKDPFSSAAATARQRDYAALLGLGSGYTPQIVVDGRWQAVGSDRGEVDHALSAAERQPAPTVPVTLALADGRARVEFGAAAGAAAADVLLVGFDRRHTDRVGGGENDGRTLTHVDVVRGFAKIGRFDGTAAAIQAKVPWPADRVAAIVQAKDGRILGVAIADAAPAS